MVDASGMTQLLFDFAKDEACCNDTAPCTLEKHAVERRRAPHTYKVDLLDQIQGDTHGK
jgi:hypothetical protein